MAAVRVLIFCATRLEMALFLERCRSVTTDRTVGGFQVVSSRDHRWDLVVSGPGVFNAACALTACLEQSRPRLILHTGIAGLFDIPGLGLGDAAVAVKDTYIHTGVDLRGFREFQTRPGQTSDGNLPQIRLDPLSFELIAGQENTRHGSYPLDEDLAESCRKCLTGQLDCQVTSGPFITVSAVTGSFEKAAALSRTFSPVMESMEGAAVAHVAALYQVPMVQVRAASNRVGERDRARWNMNRAAHTVVDICEILISGKWQV